MNSSHIQTLTTVKHSFPQCQNAKQWVGSPACSPPRLDSSPKGALPSRRKPGSVFIKYVFQYGFMYSARQASSSLVVMQPILAR